MLAIVTCISSLVAIYSIGYMHGDTGYWRFFAYVSLFVFSMTLLVSASNFLLLYMGWELVGLCSYLLIGFWFEKPAAAAAGKKAFLVNRIGDVGFALGIFLIWTTFGTLDFNSVFCRGGHVGRRLASHRDLPAAAGRRVRQECPVPAARVAARRDGGPDAGERFDPCGHDGHGGRVHGRPMQPAVCPIGRCPIRRGDHRRHHGPAGRNHRRHANRSETHPRLLDDQPPRLHVRRAWAPARWRA